MQSARRAPTYLEWHTQISPTRYFHEIKLNLLYRRRPFDTYTQPVTEYFSIFLIPRAKASCGSILYAVPLSLSLSHHPLLETGWKWRLKPLSKSWVSVGRDKRRRIKLSDVYWPGRDRSDRFIERSRLTDLTSKLYRSAEISRRCCLHPCAYIYIYIGTHLSRSPCSR